jgi:hypothetical protein
LFVGVYSKWRGLALSKVITTFNEIGHTGEASFCHTHP